MAAVHRSLLLRDIGVRDHLRIEHGDTCALQAQASSIAKRSDPRDLSGQAPSRTHTIRHT